MILKNLEVLEILADLDDSYGLADIISVLNAGRLVAVDLILAVDRLGQECNDIVGISSTDSLEAE